MTQVFEESESGFSLTIDDDKTEYNEADEVRAMFYEEVMTPAILLRRKFLRRKLLTLILNPSAP